MARFCTACGTHIADETARFCAKCGAAVAAPPTSHIAVTPSSSVSGSGWSVRKKVAAAVALTFLAMIVFAGTLEHLKSAGADGLYFGEDLTPGFVLALAVKNGQATGWARLQDPRFDARGMDVTFTGPLTKEGCDQKTELSPILDPDDCARVAITSHWGRLTRDEGTYDLSWKAGRVHFGPYEGVKGSVSGIRHPYYDGDDAATPPF